MVHSWSKTKPGCSEMDDFFNERDFDLLAKDPYTFAVLDRILRGRCDLVRTDHQSLILCHSEAPYPVWIWTPDGCGEAVMDQAWDLSQALRPFAAGYRYNIKHELAAHFIRRAEQLGTRIGVSMELFAYDCPDPVPPEVPVDGGLHICTPEDTDTAVSLMAGFYPSIGEQAPDKERIREKARERIDDHAFFFWKNGEGTAVACCLFRQNRGLASLGGVFTLPEYRRRHYAQHLVYRVTKLVKGMGYMPMLYTDAGYPASNACYEKIGYQLRGGLCTVSAL